MVALGLGVAVPLLLPVAVGDADWLAVPLGEPDTLPLGVPVALPVLDGVLLPLAVGEGLAVALTLSVSVPLGLGVDDGLAVSGLVAVLLLVQVAVLVGLTLGDALLDAGRAFWKRKQMIAKKPNQLRGDRTNTMWKLVALAKICQIPPTTTCNPPK